MINTTRGKLRYGQSFVFYVFTSHRSSKFMQSELWKLAWHLKSCMPFKNQPKNKVKKYHVTFNWNGSQVICSLIYFPLSPHGGEEAYFMDYGLWRPKMGLTG